MPDTRSFALVTLGCKVNQYESHALREAWEAQGFLESSVAGADAVCVNTCAVTGNAVADARAAIRRIRRENPTAAIVVTGCAAQTMAGEFRKLEGVSLVVPQRDKAGLLRFPAGIPAASFPAAGRAEDAYPPISVQGYDRSRAVLKVQDGCSHRCAYCIVPLTRGPSRSRAPEETLAEARRLLAAGFRELVLSGVNLAQYGRDCARAHDFWDLLALLETELAPEWAGIARLRLSSLEPGQLGQKALDTLGRSRLAAPHLHISLQSGSKQVLRRMGRGHYDPDALHGFCRDLAKVFPRFGLGADLLSGFPGEGDEDAAATEALVDTLPFTYAHVFPYSRRPGTPAAAWKDQVEPAVKKERAARLRNRAAEKKRRFLEDCLGLSRMLVAWEGTEGSSDGVNEFYTDCRFAPGRVPEGASRRSLIAVRPLEADGGMLVVEAAP